MVGLMQVWGFADYVREYGLAEQVFSIRWMNRLGTVEKTPLGDTVPENKSLQAGK